MCTHRRPYGAHTCTWLAAQISTDTRPAHTQTAPMSSSCCFLWQLRVKVWPWDVHVTQLGAAFAALKLLMPIAALWDGLWGREGQTTWGKDSALNGTVEYSEEEQEEQEMHEHSTRFVHGEKEQGELGQELLFHWGGKESKMLLSLLSLKILQGIHNTCQWEGTLFSWLQGPEVTDKLW